MVSIKKPHNKKIWLLILLATVVILIFSSIVVAEPRYYEKNMEKQNFNSYADVSIVSHLKNNSLTGNVVKNPGIIYTRILNNMTVRLSMDITAEDKQPVTVICSITAVSPAPSWSKTFESNTTELLLSGSYVVNSGVVPLNLSNIYNKSNSIDKQLGYTDPSTPVININITIENTEYNLCSFTGLSIHTGNGYYKISYETPAYMSNNIEYKVVSGNKPIINFSLTYGYIIELAGIAVIIASIYMLVAPAKNNVLKKLIEDNKDRIVIIKEPVPVMAHDIRSFDELLKLSDIYQEPIFYIENTSIFFIYHGDNNYMYVEGDDN